MIGTQFGPYRLEEELGEGTLGRSFRAEDTRRGRRVVVKVLRDTLREDDSYWGQLNRSFGKLKALRHRHIALPVELLEDRGERLIVQELVRGHTLLQEMDLREGALPLQRIYTIFRQLLSAVGHAHSAGICHLTLNPNRVMITRGGDEDRIKVLDFGLGPIYDKGSTEPGTNAVELDLNAAYYLSPEQLHKSMGAGPASDLYSIGILLYEASTGYVPFGGENLYGVGRGHLFDPPEPPSTLDPAIPWYLNATILKALAKHPSDRFEDARDFGYHLIACQTGAVLKAKPKAVRVARVVPASPQPADAESLPQEPPPEEEHPSPTLPPRSSATPQLVEPHGDETPAPQSAPGQAASSPPKGTADSLMSRLSAAAPLTPAPEQPPPPADDDSTDPAGRAAVEDDATRTSLSPMPAALAERLGVEAVVAADTDPAIVPPPPQDVRATTLEDSSPPAVEPEPEAEPEPKPPTRRKSKAERAFARLRGAASSTPLLPRGLAPRSLTPLPEGIPEPSFLQMLAVSHREQGRVPDARPVESMPVMVIGEMGISRTGFKGR